jgi:prephenate dehydrogenase
MSLVERMTIAGVGLIGGSLALDARRAGLVREIVGLGRSRANLEVALSRGVIDRIATDDADAAAADLVVLAAPVEACVDLAARLGRLAGSRTVMTDVASVKGSVVARVEAAWSGAARFVGGHPIAGSEEAGAAAARRDLFRGRLCVLTPTARTDGDAAELVHALWTSVGMRVETMAPATHDELLARVSHVPHLVAFALMRALDGRKYDGRRVLDYAATGLLDTTRIAASPAEVWRDIALSNAAALRAGLDEFRRALDDLEKSVAAGDGRALVALIEAAATARRRLDGKT